MRKEAIAAWQDADFASEAHQMTGTTFIAHVRYATTGSLDVRNTHPFLQDGRIFAHNGVLEGLDVLDERLREVGADDLVLGQTDSERVFALITASIRAHEGDESAGLVDAMSWLAAHVPIYAVNLLLSTATDMWALRYPASNELYVLDRRLDGAPDFDLRTNRIRAWSQPLCSRPSVVFASERMDNDPRWSLLAPGELVHVDSALRVSRNLVLPDAPRYLISRADLSPPVGAGAAHAEPAHDNRTRPRAGRWRVGGNRLGDRRFVRHRRRVAGRGPALLDSDVLLGTSAGAAVAAQLGSGCPLEDLFARQVAETSAEIDSGVDIDAITELFLAALA